MVEGPKGPMNCRDPERPPGQFTQPSIQHKIQGTQAIQLRRYKAWGSSGPGVSGRSASSQQVPAGHGTAGFKPQAVLTGSLAQGARGGGDPQHSYLA